MLARCTAGSDDREAVARDRASAAGVAITLASDAFAGELTSAFAPVKEAWIASVAALGIDGKAQRTTISKAEIRGMRGKTRRVGVTIGAMTPEDLASDLRAGISGKLPADYR